MILLQARLANEFPNLCNVLVCNTKDAAGHGIAERLKGDFDGDTVQAPTPLSPSTHPHGT